MITVVCSDFRGIIMRKGGFFDVDGMGFFFKVVWRVVRESRVVKGAGRRVGLVLALGR